MDIITRPARTGDLDRAATVLGDAFSDYPWTRWTVDPADHQGRITALQRLSLEFFDLSSGAVSVTSVDGAIHSVAAWLDTSAPTVPDAGDDVDARVGELEGSRHEAAQAAEQQIEGLRPDTRHLYLATVGTTPSTRGRGLASRTLAPLIRAGDDAALDIWLETSSVDNVDFYRRLGFTVTDHVVIAGGGPPVWIMVREPPSTAGYPSHPTLP